MFKTLNFFIKKHAFSLSIPLRIVCSLLLVFIVLRFFEIFAQTNSFVGNSYLNYIIGIRHDILFATIITFFLSPLWVLSFFHKRIAFITIHVLVLILALVTWILSEYYLASYLPLDHSIFVYPIKDIVEIAQSSAGFTVG
jgi:hypothetical protein